MINISNTGTQFPQSLGINANCSCCNEPILIIPNTVITNLDPHRHQL